ncbi:SDR family NAD(P)-dependent oxidoreductase [Granulosicoccus antarcticus]|uniref:Dihydroanticapsin 7-dehydrogenase n=1 Tax=Granulosicoccus antarcticus IMCC3135 TaxID=1192854 RepID=A0A2Z2NN58_9GAMM|nr:SDR family oxidoreductase [Granulosicoccus antarcticus]ASJ72892.1 Dihydroanticapsin 7-dehydrogenase [Granulosicoccus antarcticus IMCC3135]
MGDTLFDLTGKSVLVTGASSGLGAHFAQLFAQRGANVTLAARSCERLAEVCEPLAREGAQVQAVTMDVTDQASIEALFEQRCFDVVVNNAGISVPGRAMDYGISDWERTIATNLQGSFMVAQAAARALAREKKGGSIVNIASILGLRVAGQVSAYATSKAAVVQMSKSLALEWARFGIRVNVLCPGYFETALNKEFFATEAGLALIQRIPQRRLGQPEELDGAMLLLASDAGRFMTGTEIVVDGGHLVSGL